MAKKLSLIVLSDSDTKMKRFAFSHRQVMALLCVGCLFMAAVCFGAFHYRILKSKLAAKENIEQLLVRQNQVVKQQQRQLEEFANDINGIKKQLVALNQLEEKIRTVANIDDDGKSEDIFGVGGSSPEDLDADIESIRDHSRLIKEMHQQIKQISDASTYQHTSFESILGQLEQKRNLLAHTPSLRPAKGLVSSRFGYRKSPFSDRREFHKGLDIANRPGTPIVATADGTVTFFGHNGNFGLMMVVDHGFGMTTRYAHLQKGLKSVGDTVHRGDEIALMGNSGRSTGTHLHYEVRLNGVPINPKKYITN